MNDFKGAVMNQGQRSRYLKTGGILAFIVLILLYISPRSATSDSLSGGNTASDPSAATDKCTTSYSKDKPLIQYALMIDAGSTGSRIHVYKFNNCGPTPELEAEEFVQTEKRPGGSGLSAYPDDPEAAARSLDVLMETALKTVPPSYQRCSPVAVKATAGLRKLGDVKSEKILKAVRKHLEEDFPFPVISEEHHGVEVMDGKDEAIYAWITANYLLGKIGGPDKNPTAAVLDLGGGSTQIVFQPTFKDSAEGGMPKTLAEGDHKYDLDFGGRHFTLYQHSYLGYGLMEARNSLHASILNGLYEEHKTSDDATSFLKSPIPNPCIAPGMSKEVKVELGEGNPLGAMVTVNMTGPSQGAPAQCRGLAEKILHKDEECSIAPCSFKGVHQPSFEQTFAREDVYLLSYFYDRIFPLGMPESFTLGELRDLATKVCNGKQAWDVFASIQGAMEELERPDQCLDLNFMLALLHTGYEMPIDREVKIAKKIKGNELGWCLGASLPLLNKASGWQCKISEITK